MFPPVIFNVGTAGRKDFSIDGTFASNSDAILPTEKAVKTYVDGLVVGLLDDRGNYDASSNLFPATGGSGAAGAIVKGDTWRISVAGTLGGVNVNINDWIRAITDTPGQTSGNWAIMAQFDTTLNNFDASANPNYPAATKGKRYIVTAAGRVGGGAGKFVKVGDTFEALIASLGGTEVSVGSEFVVMQGYLPFTFAGTAGSTLDIGTGGTLGTAAFTPASNYEVPLTFGNGVIRLVNAISVDTTQNIATLSNLTTNGFVKTSSGTGLLSIDTNSYVTTIGGSFTGLTGAGFRDTSAAFDVTHTFTSSTVLDAGRSITWDVKNTSHSLKFTGVSTVTFPVGTNTLLGSAVANTITTTGTNSAPPLYLTGALNAAGSGTTTFPHIFHQPTGATPCTTWSSGANSGTVFGANEDASFVGDFFAAALGGTRKFRMTNSGDIHASNGLQLGSMSTNGMCAINMHGPGMLLVTNGSFGCKFANTDLRFPSNWSMVWTDGSAFGGTADLFQNRRAAAHLGLGASSATPITQTFGGAEGSGSNITGGVLNIGTRGTGTGTGGIINFQSHAAGASSSTLGTLATVMQITSATLVTLASGVDLKLGNAAITGLTPAVVAGLLTKSITLLDSTGATITLYGS